MENALHRGLFICMGLRAGPVGWGYWYLCLQLKGITMAGGRGTQQLVGCVLIHMTGPLALNLEGSAYSQQVSLCLRGDNIVWPINPTMTDEEKDTEEREELHILLLLLSQNCVPTFSFCPGSYTLCSWPCLKVKHYEQKLDPEHWKDSHLLIRKCTLLCWKNCLLSRFQLPDNRIYSVTRKSGRKGK